MPDITGNISFDQIVMAEVVGSFLNEKLYDYTFRSDIAQVIASSDALCSDVVENMDYSSIIEGVTEDIRYNHMDEVAESMVEDFTNSLVDNTMFMESMHEKIEEYLADTIMNRVNELAKRLANAERTIVELKTRMDIPKKRQFRFFS